MRYKLYLDNVDISSYVRSVKSSVKFQENRFIGNAPSECFTIELNNKDAYFNDKLNGVFTLYKEDTLSKTLKVYKQPEKIFKDLSLTLYDRMVETNIRYDTDISTYPKTIQEQLDEMSTLSGVRFDYSLLPSEVLETEINFYDNTQMIRTYLRWIAELGACNVFPQADGTLKFVPFNKETQLELTEDRYVYEFETEELYTCSGVFMEYLDLLAGTKDNHVYRLIKDNPYITSIYEVESIYSKIQGLTFTSVKNLKMRYIFELELGKKVNYKQYFSMLPCSIEVVYHAGDLSHDTCTLSGKYSSEAEEKYVNYPTIKDRIKRVEIRADQDEAKLEILAQDVSDNEARMAELEISTESIRLEVIEQIKTSEEETLATMEETYRSFVEQTSTSLSLVLEQANAYTDETTEEARKLATMFEFTSEGLRTAFNDSEDEELRRIDTLVAPDSFQVRFDKQATTKVFKEGVETGSLWLSTALTLNPLFFEGYGSGESGGVVIKWGGFD